MLPELATIISFLFLAITVTIYLRLRRREEHLHHQEQEILAKAQDQALEIISASKVEAIENKLALNTEIQKISADELKAFREVLQTVSKSIESTSKVELTKFREALESQTSKSQEQIAEQVKGEYEAALSAIKDFRCQKEAEIEAGVKKTIAEVVKAVAGKVIPVEQQQQLILDALQKAQKDGLF